MKVKRIFDVFFSFITLMILALLILILFFFATLDTWSFGIFSQKRVGQFGKFFTIFKIKTIKPNSHKISIFGELLRKTKLDELPQLFNILKGEMSFVGPRPDIPGYYDRLVGENRLILQLKPGLTSEASLKYVDEDNILKEKDQPLKYNDEVIFPDKVRMNLTYFYQRSFLLDLKIIWKTIISSI